MKERTRLRGAIIFILAPFASGIFGLSGQTTGNQPNTGMADPVALITAFDRFQSAGAGTPLVIPLVSLRGITSEGLNAGGRVTIDLSTGSVVSQVRLLPAGASFELWLIDNRAGPDPTTFADPQDVALKVAAYAEQAQPGTYRLSVTLGARSFNGFFPDRAFVVRSGQIPLSSFVLTGSSTTFDRLLRRQVRFVDDSSATPGFDPADPGSRMANFAKLIAHGRRLFLKETFAGNGRTCGTCHVETNNFTIDPEFISSLPANDPLFVAEFNPALATLERSDLLRSMGLILVNADGFDAQKGFTLRSVQNVQALGNSSVRPEASLAADFTGNGRNPDPPERLGWGNDGPPLRDFALVAIVQHAPRRLARVPNVDFRLPTDEELDALVAYQLAVGRQEDFSLPSLQLTSTLASTGKKLYLDTGSIGEPGHKNCNACHFNGGGTGAFALNPQKPGFPRLDGSPHGANIAAPTNVNDVAAALALGLPRDGGFGQIFLPLFGSFGNDDDIVPFGHLQAEEFNSGPMVEAADTGPFFHNHTAKTLEEAVAFYGTPAFQAGLFSKFGLITVQISADPNSDEVQAIAGFLRVLNVLENIRSSINITERGRQMTSLAEVRELAGLALAETADAIEVLLQGALARSVEPSILTSRAHLIAARATLDASRRAPSRAAIVPLLEQSLRNLRTARSALANLDTLPVTYRN